LRVLLALGIVFAVVGAGLLIASYVPIPKTVIRPVEVPTTTTIYTTIRETWLDETFVVGPGEATAYCGSFPSGTKLYINVNVLSGGNRDIDFYVMDESEWRVFEAGGSFYYYVEPSRTRITSFNIVWEPPSNKEISFVFSNTFSIITSKTVKATIEYERIGYKTVTTTTTTYEPSTEYTTFNELMMPGFVLTLLGIALIISHFTVYRREGKT
jgi:hypothetical protein